MASAIDDWPVRVLVSLLCELGGWKSPKTVLERYQQADLKSQRAMEGARYQLTTSN